MRDYIHGLNRQQQLLFPERLEDYVSEDAGVRAIDAYVDSLEVEALGFKTRYSDKNNNGRPAFCPKLMLKLYIYGYTNKIRSSRHLAREAHRNIELIWLLQGLKPTYKTILSIVVHLRGSQDEYTCPNNKTLAKKASPSLSKGKLGFIYSTSATDCKDCPLRSECLAKQTPHRRIWRWEHEAFMQSWRELMQTESAKAISKRRGAIVAHPFGTIKRSLGWDHYLVRGKEKVSGENALIMFCYNFKRVLNMLGTMLFNKLLLAIKAGNIEAVMQEIKRHLSFCVHYSMVYAKNSYFCNKQAYFTRLLFIRILFYPYPTQNAQ